MNERTVRVEIQCGDLKHTIEGNVEQVLTELMKFFSNIYPALEILSAITFTPDYAELTRNLGEFVNIGPQGEIILLKSGLSADKAIGVALLGAHVARKISKRQSDDMSVEELASSIRKSPKTIRNTTVDMTKSNVLERTGRGTYRVTTTGMKELMDDLMAGPDSDSQGESG